MSVLDNLRLDSKVAVVTGAGRGLGRAMAIALAGASCGIVAAARTRAQIEETAELVRTESHRSLPVPTDITDPASVQAMVDAAIAEFGRTGITVNAIGAGWIEGMGLLADEDARRQLERYLSGKRPAQPEEIAGAAVYLASDVAEYPTEQVVWVEGGTLSHV